MVNKLKLSTINYQLSTVNSQSLNSFKSVLIEN